MCHRGSTEAKLRYALCPHSKNRSRGLELYCECPNVAPKKKRGRGLKNSILRPNEDKARITKKPDSKHVFALDKWFAPLMQAAPHSL